jgi:aminoglycoside phosphotransferase (APT) family kinase protein
MDLDAARRLLPDLEVARVAPLDGGEVHANYAISTADARELVLKVYRGELSWKRDKEAFLLRLVAGRIPAPEVVHEGAGFLLMTRVPGTPARFSEADPVEVSRQLGRLLRELHAITFDSFGYIETRVTSPVPTNLEYMRRRIEPKVRSGPPALRDALETHFAEREAAFVGCETAVLCHNDAHDANVLVESGRITGLIDWENSVAADPIFDLAKAWAFSDGRSDETLDGLLEGYGPLRPDWREAFDLYVLDHLLELWVWFHQLGVTDPLPELEGYLARRISA